MNEDAFSHFEKQDKLYFVDMFNKETKKGVARIKGRIPTNSEKIKDESIQEKKAADQGIGQIFERNDVHPVIYFTLLTRKYGGDWMAFDPDVLIKVIETDFELSAGIGDIALNKILSIQVANNSTSVYESKHAFEKVVRAFNDKPANKGTDKSRNVSANRNVNESVNRSASKSANKNANKSTNKS
jgi:hypothetical protein